MQGAFVTGTDTGVGKTVASIALMERLKSRGHNVTGVKPVASGALQTPDGLRNDDALLLQAHASNQLPYDLINPAVFEPPIAPHLAAAQVGVDVSVEKLSSAVQTVARQSDRVIVEGVGGWLVPLNATETMADLASRLELPIILVVGIRLGCINHALLTMQSIQTSGCTLAGWIANHIDADCEHAADIVQAIDERCSTKRLGEIPWMSQPTQADHVAAFLNY